MRETPRTGWIPLNEPAEALTKDMEAQGFKKVTYQKKKGLQRTLWLQFLPGFWVEFRFYSSDGPTVLYARSALGLFHDWEFPPQSLGLKWLEGDWRLDLREVSHNPWLMGRMVKNIVKAFRDRWVEEGQLAPETDQERIERFRGYMSQEEWESHFQFKNQPRPRQS